MASQLTPAMQQFMDIKNKHPDCILFFRMGDFYETFFEDAKITAKELDITLTARGKDTNKVPLAGIPYHALEQYLGKMIKKGYKVAICEQVEDPKLAKGIVKREVVRIVTPGTVLENYMLNERSNNYIMAIHYEQNSFGIAFCDVSVGEFFTTELENTQEALNEIIKTNPAEIIIPDTLSETKLIQQLKQYNFLIHTYETRHFWYTSAKQALLKHFEIANLQGFGIEEKQKATTAAGALLNYLKETQLNALQHITKLSNINITEHMILDAATQRNLELIKNIRDGSQHHTLLETIDNTTTAMGGRLLKNWILRPLRNIQKIQERLDAVEEFTERILDREETKELLTKVYDMERLISKVLFGNASPRDLVALKQSLYILPFIKKILINFISQTLHNFCALPNSEKLFQLLERAIKDEPSLTIREGNIIKKGYNKELDALKEISSGGKSWIAKLEQEEREKTGIKTLKIKYNKIFGYFIEVSKTQIKNVPEHYIRKQTQVNSERYITPELKEQEDLIMNAEAKIHEREYELFQDIITQTITFAQEIKNNARQLAKIDCLCSFATCASKNNYNKPTITQTYNLNIVQGRHPVIEHIEKTTFTPNDCTLTKQKQMMIITGPNMAGKSTFMRQSALIILLAQIGSFVPAQSAQIGIVDRIFTRVGAHDDLAMRQSTFMVEMNETANILNNATDSSFIIIDEIGRGTSTFDGIAIAWAVAQHIVTKIGAKTLFATHYHQLNQLKDRHNVINNYSVQAIEQDDKIIFLHKVAQGGTDKSYGIQVAKLAGIPKDVIQEAKSIMDALENNTNTPSKKETRNNNNEYKKGLLKWT